MRLLERVFGMLWCRILGKVGIWCMKLNNGIGEQPEKRWDWLDSITIYCLGNARYLEELYAGRVPGTKWCKEL